MSTNLIAFLSTNVSNVYFEAVKLMTIDSKKEAVSSPYLSHYKAREILKELLRSLKEKIADKEEDEKLFENGDENTEINKGNTEGLTEIIEGKCFKIGTDKQCLARLMAVVHLRLGTNHTETEELEEGQKELERCLCLLEENTEGTMRNGVKQEVLNQLGLLSSQRGDLEASLKHLEAAKLLFETSEESLPWSPDDLFTVDAYSQLHDNQQNNDKQKMEKKRMDLFEDNFTYTLYYLAQVYSKLGRNTDSATFCRQTLARQLDRHTYEPFDWAMNAATLSQYYTSVNHFGMARHCLAAAETVLKGTGECPKSLRVEVLEKESQEEVESKEKEARVWADLFRCWLKYCISLLEWSVQRCYAMLDGATEKMDELSVEDEHSFNLVVTVCEGQVIGKKVLLFEGARKVFVRGQAWMQRAAEFYQLDGHCSDHVELCKDLSCLFKALAFFEPDLARQCRMHKRRIDLLTSVLNQLNSKFYLALCCQLSFEVAQIYSTMLDNKLAILEASPHPPQHPSSHTPQASAQIASKINSLSLKSIEFFERYLSYLHTPAGVLPAKFDEADERPVMLAHFHVARMHSKIIAHEPARQLHHAQLSLRNYSFLVEYCKANASSRGKMQEEVAVCEEMVVLLPSKMRKIHALM